MIAIDTSALMAIVQREPGFEACVDALATENEVLVSAGTLAETLIVAGRRHVAEEMSRLTEGLGLTVVTVSESAAREVAAAYDKWGKGVHPAGLNFGDCFAYVVAKAYDCPLLYVGDDFARTDLTSAAARTI